MRINVYCKSKGWLFDDLKAQIASCGAIPSQKPILKADAYICIRTGEACNSIKPDKTVVQVHDMKPYDLSRYGIASLTHESQNVKGNKYIQPIGTRKIADSPFPFKPTIGFYARALNHENKGVETFKLAVNKAREFCDFDVLMVGENLKVISHLGEYEKRAATPADYARVSALFTASETPMIPISVYEAISVGRAIITTPRVFPFEYEGLKFGRTWEELADKIIEHIGEYRKCKGVNTFTREAWCKKQIELAKSLI